VQSVLNQLTELEAALVPYERIKEQLAGARVRYRTLTDEFVTELKSRCHAMNDKQKRDLVLELFAEDVQAGLGVAMAEKRQELVRFMERLWDKYRVTLHQLHDQRVKLENEVSSILQALRYS
jgi:type I restriction enzyme M protein